MQRWQGQSLGLVATLTLVALVTLSGLAVFLTAPRSDPAPTAMLAGVGDGTPDARSSDEVLLPNVTTCAVEPRSYSQTLQLLEPYLSGRFEPPAAYLDSRQVAGEAELPAGQRPAPATTDRIAAVWGMYQGCQRSYEYLRAANLFSYAGLTKYYVSGTGPNDHDIDLLDREPASADALPQLDLPSTRAMTDLRLIGDDRAAAFISTGWTEGPSPSRAGRLEGYGHIYFVREGNQWLIDELTWWETTAQG